MSTATTMSWEDYERLPEDLGVEYIDGQVVVNARPNRRHQAAVRRLANLLEAATHGSAIVVAEWAWKPGEDEFSPDVLVTPQTDEQARFTGTPVLVVEVLSTNRAHDLVTKAAKYAHAGLPRYWVVDQDDETVTAFELVGGTYREVASVTADGEVDWDFGAGRARLCPSHLFRE